MTFTTIQIRTTRAQARALRASFYGRCANGKKQLVADLLAGRVIHLKPSGKDHRSEPQFFNAEREDALELTRRARELGMTRNQYLKLLLFGVQAAGRGVPGKWGNITVNMTDAQWAAWRASDYGQHGGGTLFVRDLLAGTVQRLDAPRDSGVRTRRFIGASKRDRDTLLRRAEAQGLSRSDFVHRALFGKNAQGAA